MEARGELYVHGEGSADAWNGRVQRTRTVYIKALVSTYGAVETEFGLDGRRR
jgi:hypothetical protein